MRDSHVETRTKGSARKMFDIESSEFNSRKNPRRKATNVRDYHVGDEADPDYVWFLNFLSENSEHSKPSMEKISRHEDEDNNENENKNEDEDDNENKDEDETYKDPQYCMFLKQLTGNGKSYKLNISKSDETPCFLEYEKQYDTTTDMNVTIGNNGGHFMQISPKVERISQGKNSEVLIKKDDLKKMDVVSCYQSFLEGSVPSKYGQFIYEGKQVNYEETVTNSDSDTDSDILIWDKDQTLSEVNKKQLQREKKEPSLRKKLLRILKEPYNEEEYEELSKYIQEEKPICRLLPLRDRVVSAALDGLTKSVLDDGPESFRKKLKAVKNERPRALNLMRMFRFWLEHLPNEKIFMPWSHKEFMDVLPSSRKRSHNVSR
ncbi:hypothetical protein LXL04_030304 [Taraxacum kok-saghyz]